MVHTVPLSAEKPVTTLATPQGFPSPAVRKNGISDPGPHQEK